MGDIKSCRFEWPGESPHFIPNKFHQNNMDLIITDIKGQLISNNKKIKDELHVPFINCQLLSTLKFTSKTLIYMSECVG